VEETRLDCIGKHSGPSVIAHFETSIKVPDLSLTYLLAAIYDLNPK